MSVTLPLTGSGDATKIAATDTIVGEEYPYAKLASGAVGATTPINTGEGAATNAMRTTIASDSAVIGAVNESAPGTDTASSGLNGRLQRIAQRLTSLIALLPASLGQKAMAASLAVTVASDQSAVPVSGTVTTNAGTGTRTVTGDVAHDAADSGSPVKVGGKARTTNPTAVADADRVDATFDDVGRQVVVLNQVRDLTGRQATTLSNTTETTIVTAAASIFNDLVLLVMTNASATAVSVTIRDDTAGTILGIFDLAANGGAVFPFAVPVAQAVVNKPWTAQLSAGSITVHVFAQFVKNV